MRVIEQAYDDKFPGDLFEESNATINWQPLAESYDSWTAALVAMAQSMNYELREADLVVQEPGRKAPPAREFKIMNPRGVAFYLITVPLLEIFFWVNAAHDDTIHPDVVLAESLGARVTVTEEGSVIELNGQQIVDLRTTSDRVREAHRRRRDFQRGN